MPGYPFYLDEHAYVRHRARQVRQSIYEDARHTLATPRDYAGRLPEHPDAHDDVFAWLDQPAQQLLPLMGQDPLRFIDYFPAGGVAAYEKIDLNTLALDNGIAAPEYQYELGGMLAQDYTFNFAINAATDALAAALFQDLNDRYVGRSAERPRWELLANLASGDDPPDPINAEYITLYNYAADPPIPVTRMEVESFQFAKSPEEIAPGLHLFYGELVVTDFFAQA